jgi:hypothetical protein
MAQTILESSLRFASLGLPLSLAGLTGTRRDLSADRLYCFLAD